VKPAAVRRGIVALTASAAGLLGACAGQPAEREAGPPHSRGSATIVAAAAVHGTEAPATEPPGTGAPDSSVVAPPTTAAPAPPTPPAGPPPPGVPARVPPPEGIVAPGAEKVPFSGFWAPIGPLVGGTPAMYGTRVPTAPGSPTAVGVAWIDPGAVRFQFQPGTTDPPGPWGTPSRVLPEWQSTLAAVFNGGFKTKDSRGGIFLDGRLTAPLRPGAASAVLTKDGVLTIGAWGRDVGPGFDVVAVRQNLDLMVDGGHNLAVDNTAWGATLKGALRVPRSALGMRADGSIMYVGGPDLTAKELGDILVEVGCQRAMELDINGTWVLFTSFVWDPVAAAAVPTRLNDAMVGVGRFLVNDERDFFSVFVRF
jgi:hypothetical protein